MPHKTPRLTSRSCNQNSHGMKFNKKSVLTALVALIVGGLGNGVWEYVLEPVFHKGAAFVLSVATLGATSFKDALYLEIAKGFHEKDSIFTAKLLTALVVYGMLAATFALTRSAKTLVSRIESSKEEIGKLGLEISGKLTEMMDRQVNLERIRVMETRSADQLIRARRLQRSTFGIWVPSVAFAAWMLVGLVKSRYVNSAITHFEQSVAIVAPYASDREVVMLRSRFGLLASREDYQRILSEIESIGARGHVNIPQFKAW